MSNSLGDAAMLLLLLMAFLFSCMWVFVFPVVGMLYMLGYLT